MTAALAGAAFGLTRPPFEPGPGYHFPSPAELRARVKVSKSQGAKIYASGERVTVTGSDGTVYNLNRFHGRYVDILLPDAWLGPQALSEDQVHHFVDRTDMIYQYFLDLVGVEPAGDGPVPISIYPHACGGALGCAGAGTKGVDMADVPEYRTGFWHEIEGDFPLGVLVHELTHNFDVFYPYLAYISDGPHGWTNFLTNYYYAFAHEGDSVDSPEDDTQLALDYTQWYFRNPTATWENCVRDDQCESQGILPTNTYGGFGLRIALRYGPQTVLGFSAFLRQYVQSHEPPATAEEKNDLYVEALAAGAHRNLGCVADALRWPVSDALRERMNQLYGPRNPDCEDQDHDGFTPLQGDCNDHQASIHPGATDRPNHLDDNCDGAVDEPSYKNAGGSAIADSRLLAVPADVSGAASDSKMDFYRIHLRSPERIQLGFCNSGGVVGQVGIGRSLPSPTGLYLPIDGCFHQTFLLGTGDWNLGVSMGSAGPTDYTLTVRQMSPWPLPPWARTAPPQSVGTQFVLKAPTAVPLPHTPGAPMSVRFWVSGQGYVGTVPYSRNASLAWTPPAGVDPLADGLTYRAQILAGGAPVYEVTPPQTFGR